MSKTSTAKKENPLGPFGYVDELTLGERVALAAASMAIHELPFLQQGSDAADMQAMLVDPLSCGRGGYILAKALAIFNSFSGFREGALDDVDGKSNSGRYFLEGCEKFIARAIEQGKVSNSDNQYFDNGEIVTFEPKPSTPAGKVAKLCDGVKKAGDSRA
jgi:hypothetical protein